MLDVIASLPDSAMLSRIQFAFTVSYHIIFPTITIGLSLYLAFMEGMWLKTNNPVYLQQVKFWIKPFAITFGMGVVSGVVLSYEFGTNFSKFSEVVGPVLAPLLAYEVLTAFFFRGGLLGHYAIRLDTGLA
jgi:cytochrome d ubiquinol oxidase subunit I